MQRRQFIKGLSLGALVAGAPSFASALKPQNAVDVIVLGAGLAGLCAAYNLEKLGLSVLVLEADSRVGGRIKTLKHVASQPEVGGMQIGKGYGYTRALSAELGLSLEPLSGFMRGNAMVVDEQLFNVKQWSNHRVNQLAKHERHIPPNRLFFHYLKNAPQLDLATSWLQPKYQHLDRSMASLLMDLGASEQAIALMNANVNANSLADLSALDALHIYKQMLSGGRGADKIVGGNSLLPQTLASRLKSDILLDKSVTKISSQNGFFVECSDGTQYRAKRGICTIPLPALRKIKLDAPVTKVQRAAIAQFNYTAITQVHFEVIDPSWVDDHLPGNLWTNHPLIGRVFASTDGSGKASHLVAWLNGNAAQSIDKLSSGQAMHQVHQALIAVRPSLRGKIKPVYLQSWGNSPFSGGAYSSFGPGQVTAFAGQFQQAAGTMHFAGEHTNHEYSGIESALVSGLVAVEQIQASK